MITISTRLLKEAEHRIDIGEIDSCSCCIYRDDCRGVYSIGGEPQFPFCADATLDEHFDLEQYKEMIKKEWNDMNLLEKICKELEVKIGEVWRGSDGFLYKIRADGLVETFDSDGGYLDASTIYWEDILTGLLKPAWKPKLSQVVYVPNILEEECLCTELVWNNDYKKMLWFERGLVFEEENEAIECANKMLELANK